MAVLEVYGPVIAMLVMGAAFAIGNLMVAWLLRPSVKVRDKYMVYECGERPWGQAQLQMDVQYYVIALIFVIFDVEVIFIAPWAVIFRDFANLVLVPMLVFLAIVFVPFIYAWRKGGIEWIH